MASFMTLYSSPRSVVQASRTSKTYRKSPLYIYVQLPSTIMADVAPETPHYVLPPETQADCELTELTTGLFNLMFL